MKDWSELRKWLINPTFIVLFCFFLVGCASTEKRATVEDPYEELNRRIYTFNQGVDDYISHPLVTAYDQVTPDFLQQGVGNFFTNLNNVQVVVNDLLQGKIKQGTKDTGRFAINSTLGVFGLFDIAKYVGLNQNEEDFGQTLGVWGVPAGPYLVLPFLGPSTLFQGVPGTTVDVLSNPVSYATALPMVQVLSAVNARSEAEESLDFIDKSALDPYTFTREAYMQWRQHLITDGRSTTQASFNELEDEMFAEENEDNELDALESELNGSFGKSQASSTEKLKVVEETGGEQVDRALDLLEVELKKSAEEGQQTLLQQESQNEDETSGNNLGDEPFSLEQD